MLHINPFSSFISMDPRTLATLNSHPIGVAYDPVLVKTTGGTGMIKIYADENSGPYLAITGVFTFFGVIGIILISYTYQLLFTLIAIESPPSIRLPASTDEEDQHGAGITSSTTTTESGGDITTASSEYITSSIRSTLRHLRKEGGFFSLWRGFGIYLYMCIIIVIWNVVGILLVSPIVRDLPPKYWWVETAIAGLISAVAASRAALVWTYAKIAAPRPYWFFLESQRITWVQASKTIPATLLAYALTQLPYLPLSPAPNQNVEVPPDGELPPIDGGVPPSGFIIMSLLTLTAVLIGVPVNLVLTRIQVSVLPDDPTIIPCDKTFGVVHEEQEDTDSDTSESTPTVKALTIKEAIKTLDWPLLKRAYLFCLKAILIFVVIGFQFFCLWLLVAVLVR